MEIQVETDRNIIRSTDRLAREVFNQSYKLIDHFYFPKKMHFIMYWAIIRTVCLSEILLQIFHEPILHLPRLFACCLL